MFERKNFAPHNYSICYDLTFTICCPRSEFRDPNNIPAEFETVPKVQDVYRLAIASDADEVQYDKFLAAMQSLKHSEEIQAEYTVYRKNLGYATPAFKC